MSTSSTKLRLLPKMGLIGLSLFTGFSLSVDYLKLAIQPTPPAYAQSATCSSVRAVTFSGRTSGSMTGKPNIRTNLRANPTTSAGVLATIPPNTMLTFSGWTYGASVTDIWTGRADQRWFRVTYQGRTGWVASGVIYGNPPNSTPTCLATGGGQPGQMHRNPEVFYRWAKSQVGISRLDRSDLRGQCVTLIARYIQEVYLTGSQRTAAIAFGHGKDTARVVASRWPNFFTPVTNQGLPRRGAIISFPDIGIVGGVRYGHVAIVMEARQLSNGQRQVRILDSNGDSRGPNSNVREYTYWVNIPDGTAQRYGRGIYWTNPR
ncbi:MAG: SH3 domain-containing protein [Spirulina sp.]